jgi:tetratricopeptide (TPR) repeat protein
VGEVAADVGKYARAAGDPARGAAMLEEGLRVLRTTRAADDPFVVAAVGELAQARYQQAKFPEAERLHRETVRLATRRFGADAPQTGEYLMRLGGFLVFTGRIADGLPYLQRALASAQKAFGDNHPRTIAARITLADAFLNQPDLRSAEQMLRPALAAARIVYREAHPQLANVVARLGTSVANQQRLEEAEPLIREGLALRTTLLGADHPDVQLSRVELGRLYQAQNRFAPAETLFVSAMQSRRRVLGETSPAVASSLTDLGRLASLRADWPAAEQWQREAVPVWRVSKVEDQALMSEALMAVAILRQGRTREADTVLRRVMAARAAASGPRHWTVGDAAEKLSSVQMDLGRVDAADSLTQLGLAIRREVYGPRSPQVAFQLPNVASVREVRGDSAGAIAPLREAREMLLAVRPPTDLNVVSVEGSLALDLCATGAVREGEPLSASVLARVPESLTAASRTRFVGIRGYCQLRAGALDSAAATLVRAEEMQRTLPLPTVSRIRPALYGWLATVYERLGRTDEAARWRAMLAGR